MLLAIDVGNTQITLGLFDGPNLKQTWRLQTRRDATSDELGVTLQQMLPVVGVDVVIASVVPPIDASLKEACVRYLKAQPLFVNHLTKLGIRIRTKTPSEVGADRLVNAVAVHHRFKKSAIVVDFGTATTFDCIHSNGDYLGGVIAPGLQIAHEALSTKTAKLPKVPFEIPTKAIGRTTKESLQSGLYWGYIGLVERVVSELAREMKSKPMIIITGGLSVVIGPKLKGKVRIEPNLTLEGLQVIWDLNSRRANK